MIPLQEYLEPDDTLSDAARILRTARRDEGKIGVKGLPVIDSEGKMVGFLSMGDILKAVFPFYMTLANLGDFTWEGMVVNIAEKAGHRKISELMTKEVVSIEESAPLMECVDHMLKNDVKRLPVIGEDGRVVGILHEIDVFLTITKSMLDENPGNAK
jgi:CBS domain-containing protein